MIQYVLAVVFVAGAWVLYECWQLRKHNKGTKQTYEDGVKRGYDLGYEQRKRDERMSK